MLKTKLVNSFYAILLGLITLIGCQSEESVKMKEDKSDTFTTFQLKNEDWYRFIDSCTTLFDGENSSIDSISVYYMRLNTPSVIGSPKYIVWKKNGLVEKGEFNFRDSIYNQRFFFGSFRKRGIVLTEIDLRDNKFKKSEKNILDLNSDNRLSNSCYEIANATCQKSTNALKINVEIYDSCFDKYFSRKLSYSLVDSTTLISLKLDK